jgi:uncharacterized membrane protein
MANDSSAVYNILAFNFDGQDTAKETVKQIRSSGALEGYKIAAEAIVEQDENGKVSIHEPGKGGVGAAVGALGGGLLGLIGGPSGLLAWAVGGAVVGGVAGKYLGRPISKGDLKEIGEAMQPDSSAFMLLLEDKDSEDVIKSMSGYSANVVTLTVGDELSGQIASYAAGAATDDQGNVIAGAGGVAADAEGDVAAAGAVAAGTTSDDDSSS